MSHYACSLCRFWPVNCIFWPIKTLAIPPLLWPVNCIKIGEHVALLSDPTVYSLYCACNFTLNMFKGFVFTYFKQERQCLWNYRLFKLFWGYNKAKDKHWMFAFFLTSKISPLHVSKKSPTKTFNGDFRPCLPLEKFEKSIVPWTLYSYLKYVNTKSWNIFKVKLQGSKVKRIKSYHGCH